MLEILSSIPRTGPGRTGRMAQVEEFLPSKHEAGRSNPIK
jgi:hypothetical protein